MELNELKKNSSTYMGTVVVLKVLLAAKLGVEIGWLEV